MIYLDNAATTPILSQVVNETLMCVACFGNPSSSYDVKDFNWKEKIAEVRGQIANVINCKPKEIYFTSGGTEADNMAIKGIALANRNIGRHIITSKIEHPAVLNTCKFLEQYLDFEITYLDVNKEGMVDPEDVERAIRKDTVLVSIMAANNEIGTIQPLKEIGAITHRYKIYFHCDAVQGFLHMPIDVEEMNINLLSISGHKIGAPKGIGALYVRSGTNIVPLIHGGGQEDGLRNGTENTLGALAIGKAVEIGSKNFSENCQKEFELRKSFETLLITKLGKDEVTINGADNEHTLPGTTNITFKSMTNSNILEYLEELEIYASAGSACSSGSSKPSHVLRAIGLSYKECEHTVRFSFNANHNTMDDVRETVDLLEVLYKVKRKK